VTLVWPPYLSTDSKLVEFNVPLDT